MATPLQIAYPVGNFRRGRRTRVRVLTLHTSEGARTVESLGGFLRSISNASYHAATDDRKIAYYVNRKNEAWHLRNGNPVADGFCFCGFAKWSRAEWFEHPVMLENAAWWLASCARERNVPLRWLSVSTARNAIRNADHAGGVIDHDDYSNATSDGTHWDCGEGLPKDWIIARAIQIQLGQGDLPRGTTPSTRKDNDTMENFLVNSGKGTLKLNCPVGKSSSVTSRAWFSASASWGKANLKFYSQDDDSGVEDWEWNIVVKNGLSDRPWKELKSGVTQINIVYDFESPGVICLETLAK